MSVRIATPTEPVKLRAQAYMDDPLARARLDLLGKHGMLKDMVLLSPGMPVREGWVTFVGYPDVKWYAQVLGFSNPRYKRFLNENQHLWPSSFVVAVRESRSKAREEAAKAAVLQLPTYLGKIGLLRGR